VSASSALAGPRHAERRWPDWTWARVVTASVWVAASLALGTLLTWITAELAFVDFEDSQTSTPLGPLCLLGAGLAFAAGPVAVARRRHRWGYVALAALAAVPIAAVVALVVWPNRHLS
jgi:hypothetical protein